jgi:hypothetical protein
MSRLATARGPCIEEGANLVLGQGCHLRAREAGFVVAEGVVMAR